MILEAAIVNITRNLDIIIKNDGKGISSHSNLKTEALSCLQSLIEKAPHAEFLSLLESENHDILLGYLINVLCQLAKSDKSKTIRSHALETLLSLVVRIEEIHDIKENSGKCVLKLISSALPGVSSTLFRLIMSDTKLPTNLIVSAIKILAKFIQLTFVRCDHDSHNKVDEPLKDICENLAIRLSFMINYVTCHDEFMHGDVSYELIDLCLVIVCHTNLQLLSKFLKSLVKYVAFVNSSNKVKAHSMRSEMEFKIMLIVDSIRDQIRDCDDNCDSLESIVIKSIFHSLDYFNEHCLTMLPSERRTELSTLTGFFKLMPADSLTTFFELPNRSQELVQIFIKLTKFSTQQPFLFLTEAHIDNQALESNTRINTVEKRFMHINMEELLIIKDCCLVIGKNVEWLLLRDFLQSTMCSFSCLGNLYITNLILEGGIERGDDSDQVARFCHQYIEYYISNIKEMSTGLSLRLQMSTQVDQENVLKIVIAIETVLTLVKVYLSKVESDRQRTVLLKPLLYPLLNWSSSSSRAVSEASLCALTQISQLYLQDSIKSLIITNIDYIVDGVSRNMDSFADNLEITNVIAVALKLSSIDSFFYFNDIFERVFKLLANYHHTHRSKSIALLFYRTLDILNSWKDAIQDIATDSEIFDPLRDDKYLIDIKKDLSIGKRIKKLRDDSAESVKFQEQVEEIGSKESQEQSVEEIVATQPDGNDNTETDELDTKKPRGRDVELTEKILKHCVNLVSSNHNETKILALKAASCGFRLLRDEEDTLLPLVHQLWTPLLRRLAGDYEHNLEVNLCAFECLISMGLYSKDFIKGRTTDTIVPRLCVFLESQANLSRNKKDHGPYCMTMAYKCQHKILKNLGPLAFHIQLAYKNLWRVVKVVIAYLSPSQTPSLREAARHSLGHLIALDADCVWYFARESGHLNELPFDLIFKL